MIDEILNAYGARFVIAIGGVFLALVVLVAVLWIIRNKAPSPFVRGGRSRQPRLQVLDAAAVDARRRLVLVRRDNIEHLILIGGPSDIVVESGIGEPKAYLAGELAANAALPEHQAAETRIAQQEQAALHTLERKLQAEEPAPRADKTPPRDVRMPPKEMRAPKRDEPLELVMPSAPPVAERPKRPEPPAAQAVSAPDIAPEMTKPPTRPAPPPPTPVAQPAPRAPVAQEAPAPSSRIEPSVPMPTVPMPSKAPEPKREEAPNVELAPAPSQQPPSVRAEDAGLALDAARARVLAPKVEPFSADRFKAPAENIDIPAPSEPAPRVDPDMESIKSEFEKILDADVLSEPPQRPRPTVEPPVARAIPPMGANSAPTMPSVDANRPANGNEGNLQNEIARIFGEMGEPRKN